MTAALAACQAESLEPPRAATSTAQAALAPTSTPTPLISNAPTATMSARVSGVTTAEVGIDASASELTLWVSDPSGTALEAIEEGIADFTAKTGIQVEVLRTAPRLLPELMQSAVISGTLPDLVLHPIEYSHGWEEEGILDAAAATAVLEELGRDTFVPGALSQLTVDADSGTVAALPSDGWPQLLIYRTDWFEDLGLAPPNTFASLAIAAETIFEEDSPVSGLIVPTDSSLVSTQHVFEHLALANGCRLVNREGEITLLHPACLEALEYYRGLINAYSPIGLQTEISALNGYLSGRTGIIIATPDVLPIIAGLSDVAGPSCPECTTPDFLAKNTGIITKLQGDGADAAPAGLSSLMALGITSVSDAEAATTFAKYWFNELYPQWLKVNPEQKVPMRRGTSAEDTLFLDLWAEAPLTEDGVTLADVYGPETATLLSQDTASTERWGLAQGRGSLLTTLYEELLLAPLLQDMLSGYFSSSQTIVEMYLIAVDAVPGYDFPIQVAPTPTP